MTSPDKPKRGFAAMEPEQRRAIVKLGSNAVPAEKRTFPKRRDVAAAAAAAAAAAGAKGGANVPAEKRTFTTVPLLASSAGKKGALASWDKKRESEETER